MSQQTPQKPEKEYRAGTIKAAIWRHEHDRDGETIVSYSITLQKRYYDRDTKTWHDSDSFFPEDLPKALLVLAKAYEYVMLREKDSANDFPPAEAAEVAQI